MSGLNTLTKLIQEVSYIENNMINKIKKNNKEYDETYQLGNQQYETSYKE
jgi:hypothetical protein